MTLSVLVASRDNKAPQGLAHVPPHILTISNTPGWATGSNELLDGCSTDALFCDDDITFLPESFVDFDRYASQADIIGFDLRYPDGPPCPGAQHGLNERAELYDIHPDGAAYVAHVSTSAIWISHRVIAAGVRFPVWPGIHCEDVVFNLAAWLAGFRVLYAPLPVTHHLTPQGVGQTKVSEIDLWPRLGINYQMMREWMTKSGIAEAVRDGRIPNGARAL